MLFKALSSSVGPHVHGDTSATYIDVGSNEDCSIGIFIVHPGLFHQKFIGIFLKSVN